MEDKKFEYELETIKKNNKDLHVLRLQHKLIEEQSAYIYDKIKELQLQNKELSNTIGGREVLNEAIKEGRKFNLRSKFFKLRNELEEKGWL